MTLPAIRRKRVDRITVPIWSPRPVWKEDVEDFARRPAFELQASSGGLLPGRKAFVGLAGFWSEQTGKWADMVNGLPKSRTQSRG
jgi:hypothetical protein